MFFALLPVRLSPMLAVVIVIGVIAVAFFAAKEAVTDRDLAISRWEDAQSRWLSDCAAMKRPIDDCTMSWSKNYLLRDVYLKKVAP